MRIYLIILSALQLLSLFLGILIGILALYTYGTIFEIPLSYPVACLSFGFLYFLEKGNPSKT